MAKDCPWVCPRCLGKLNDGPTTWQCGECGLCYRGLRGIPDLRLHDDVYLANDDDWSIASALNAEFDRLSFEELLHRYFERTGDVAADLKARQIRHILTAPGHVSHWLEAIGPARGTGTDSRPGMRQRLVSRGGRPRGAGAGAPGRRHRDAVVDRRAEAARGVWSRSDPARLRCARRHAAEGGSALRHRGRRRDRARGGPAIRPWRGVSRASARRPTVPGLAQSVQPESRAARSGLGRGLSPSMRDGAVMSGSSEAWSSGRSGRWASWNGAGCSSEPGSAAVGSRPRRFPDPTSGR